METAEALAALHASDDVDGGADTAEALAALVAQLRTIVASGRSLPAERTLAEQLGVKRHRLRLALDRLRREGELAPARIGRRRNAPSPRAGESMVRDTNPLEIIEMRLVIEPGLARLAAMRASPFEISRIERAATTPPDGDTGAIDRAFHLAVAAGARNSLGVELYGLLRRVGTDARVRVGTSDTTCPKRLAQRDTEHRAIARAITARDPEGAEQAMRVHLIAVQRRIIERLTPGLTAA